MAKDTTATNDEALLVAARAKEARRLELRQKREAEREKRAGESKDDAFKRIATRRTNQALDSIALLRGLANKANYEYTDGQYEQIVRALRAGVDKVEADFKAGGPQRAENGFSL